MKARLSALIAATLLLAAPAWAHHSGAMYDPAKVVSLTGSVMEFSWKNPHAEISILGAEAGGRAEQWSLECSTPNILARKGWANDSLKPGDKISVTMRPMKDGSKAGQILTVVTAKGVTLKDHDY
jgi:hypothetical protein